MRHADDNAVVRYATLCSGIEGATAAVEPLGGFEPEFFSEIEPFPSRFLAERWPEVRLPQSNGLHPRWEKAIERQPNG